MDHGASRPLGAYPTKRSRKRKSRPEKESEPNNTGLQKKAY
jgi:hypothetical protein